MDPVDDDDCDTTPPPATVLFAVPHAPPPPPPYVLQGTEDDADVDPLSSASLRAVALVPVVGRNLAPAPVKPLDTFAEMQLALRRRQQQKQGVSEAELKAAVDGVDNIRLLRTLPQQVAAVDEARRVEALLPPGAGGLAGRFPTYDVSELRRILDLDAETQRLLLIAATSAKQAREQRLGDLIAVPVKIKEVQMWREHLSRIMSYVARSSDSCTQHRSFRSAHRL